MTTPGATPILLWCASCGAAFVEGVAFAHDDHHGHVTLRCPACTQRRPHLRLVKGHG
jgi:DNA-directed RNA polymerase subunit RPC12/RpoP